jgi:hypothetical protein
MKLSTTLSHITTVPNSNNSKVISELASLYPMVIGEIKGNCR